MTSAYVSIGHGVRPDGRFDPGAVDAASGAREYDGNRDLARQLTDLLRSAGVTVTSEADQPPEMDADYVGTVDAVNAIRPDVAIDLHQDWSGGSPDDVWPLVHPAGGVGLDWANRMIAEAKAAGLTTRGPAARSDLYFLNGTTCPAVLVESGRVGKPRDVPAIARALANATLSILGGPAIPPEGPLPPSGSPGAPPGDQTSPPADQVPPWPGQLLQAGTTGPNVTTWQARMDKRGWWIAIDGAYGPESEGVCRSFQLEKGLAADGVVGPDTWAAAWSAPIT